MPITRSCYITLKALKTHKNLNVDAIESKRPLVMPLLLPCMEKMGSCHRPGATEAQRKTSIGTKRFLETVQLLFRIRCKENVDFNSAIKKKKKKSGKIILQIETRNYTFSH